MSARDHFPRLAPGSLTDVQREVYGAILGGRRAVAAATLTDDGGHLQGPFNALLFAPAVGLRMQALGESIRFDLSLSDRERELATLYAAARFGSSYETAVHRRLGMAAGLTAPEVAVLASAQAPEGLTDRERTILELVAALCDEQVGESVRADAVATLGRQAVVELTVLAGYYRALAMLLDTCGGNEDV